MLYEHLVYIFMTGMYAVVVVFAAGVISEIVPTMARKPIFSHRAAATSIVAVGVLIPLAWMQNMYSASIPEGFQIAAMFVALSLVVPLGTLFYRLARNAVARDGSDRRADPVCRRPRSPPSRSGSRANWHTP